MNARERFKNVLNFEPVDRLPTYEWVPHWDLTLERWHCEGMPREVHEFDDVVKYFGLDVLHWATVAPSTTVKDEAEFVRDMAGYKERRKTLFSDDPLESTWHITGGAWQNVPMDRFGQWSQEQDNGDAIVAVYLAGFFWHPRTLLGVERHLLSFYDLPDVLHEMNTDLTEFNLRAIDRLVEVLSPDVAVMMEDMSYNHGPMLSKEHFDEFLAPYYREITKKLSDHGIQCMVDSDGDIMPCAEWFTDVGVIGFEPLEHQAGVDIVELRRRHPDLRIIGGYDKMVMPHGEAAMRREFERIFPVMKQGGYVVSVDHQTPPSVSLENYRTYAELFKEYCEAAAADMRCRGSQ